MIVPERIGNISPQEISEEAIFLINNNELLIEQKLNLTNERGKKGAVRKLSYLIIDLIKKLNHYQGSSISENVD